MKTRFPLLFALPLFSIVFSCALFKPVQTVKTAPTTPTPNTKPKKVAPQIVEQAKADEVQPFYEGSSDKDLKDLPPDPPAEEEQVIGSEVEEEIAKSVKNEVPKFDIPIVINAQVEKWINYFQGRGRKYYAAWLSRSERYIPMMKKILRENGLPEDLVYLSMIESGFKPYAYSRARASGPWQFIKGTGRLYGLQTNFWIDERRDPEKSSIAAAQHLKDLYDRYNSWYLAAASYNAGAGKIDKAIRKYSTEDFWEMTTKKRRYLRAETKDYVPKLIAAALMAKSPEKYGFTDIQFDEPLEYDKVSVPEPTELSKIATSLDIQLQTLYDLNPELLRGITPPNMADYELKLPKKTRERFIAAYPSIRRESAVVVSRHDVRRGDTLASIARKYGKSVEAIQTFNNLKTKKVKPGQQLAIPVYQTPTRVASKDPEVTSNNLVAAFSEENAEPKGRNKSTYKVREGDTLWSISRRFNVSVSELRNWNDLGSASIHPGKKLKLFARADPSFIGASKDAAPPTIITPVTETKVSTAANSADTSASWISYQVQDGDSLWSISKKFKVKVSDLTEWNENASRNIKPGQTLKIRSTGT